MASQETAGGACQPKTPPSSRPAGWPSSPLYNRPPLAATAGPSALASAPRTSQKLRLPKYPSDGASQGGSQQGKEDPMAQVTGWVFRTPPRRSSTYRSVYTLALCVPLFVFATACWGGQTLSLWLPLGEMGGSQQRVRKAVSILAKAALPNLPASSPTPPSSRNTPKVQQLLQKRRKVSYLAQHRLGREACERHAIKTGW